jgi:hypothetical protein
VRPFGVAELGVRLIYMNAIPSADGDAWNNAEGQSEALPIMLRYRPNLKDFLGDTRYPRLLKIYWDYEQTNTSGLPSDEQSNQMREFEDLIQSELDPERVAILAFIRTHSGTRQWNYYVGDTALLSQRINKALNGLPVLPIELQVQDDPNWEELRALIQKCN